MKVFLFVLTTLLTTTVFAQQPYNIEAAQKMATENNAPGLAATYKGVRVYFDPDDKKYYMEESFKRKYGQRVVRSLDSLYKAQNIMLMLAAGQSDATARQLDVQSQDISMKKHESKNSFLAKSYRGRRMDEYRRDYNGMQFKWKLKPLNTVLGSSIIGTSAAVYFMGSSIIESKINDLKESDFNDPNDYSKEVKSLGRTRRTIGYVCAGTSVAGAIVILTGLYREYSDGVNIGHNMTISDAGVGISFTRKF